MAGPDRPGPDRPADIIRELADAATRRADVAEELNRALAERVRQMELHLAEIRGQSSGFGRLAPWVAIVLSAATLLSRFVLP